MSTKICPLFYACPDDIPFECKGDRCAWYVPPFTAKQEGRCAVQCLGSLPVLASEVGKL